MLRHVSFRPVVPERAPVSARRTRPCPRRLRLLFYSLLVVSIGLVSVATATAQGSAARQSALASLEYLRTEMDRYHDRFPVYDDVSSAGNHFHALAKIPNGTTQATVNGSWTDSPHSGATAIRCEFVRTFSNPFGGFYFQNGVLPLGARAPQLNFGDVPNAGVNLTGATELTFWARGARGGERVEFFVAGVGYDPLTGNPTAPYPDSSRRRPSMGTSFTLSQGWQRFEISLIGMDLSYVLGGFGWVASEDVVFFLDDIQYELDDTTKAARLNQPRFTRSFTTLPLQPDPSDGNRDDDIDLVLRNSAFTYDNALALLAFLAGGTPDDVRRARLIGDAFVYSSRNDRYFNDNRACGSSDVVDAVNGARMRSAYAAGDIALPDGWTPNGRLKTVPVPGFYADVGQSFTEVEQKYVDTGNNAWVIIALAALYERTGEAVYLSTACKLGQFVRAFRDDIGAYGGFRGGVADPEDDAIRSYRVYASSEHNIDLAVAFRQLARLTASSLWDNEAQHARSFVEAMWDSSRGCYLAGTLDPWQRNLNPNQLPLDVQAWSIQAFPGLLSIHPEVISCAESNHRTVDGGLDGFDFNDDRDRVWLEGTGQMALSYQLVGQSSQAERFRSTLRLAQLSAPRADGYGIVAASRDGLTTGFDFKYFARLHVGATAWNVLAQLTFNPFEPNDQPPPTEVSLTTSVESPQPLGTVVGLTASVTGGTGSYEYKFWQQSWATGVWSVLRDWGAESTYSWGPDAAGGYNLAVEVRQPGSSDTPISAAINFSVRGGGGPGSMASVDLTSSPSSPQPVGSTILLTATGHGGTPPYAYRFWVQPLSTGTWQIVQDWGATATLAWTPSVADLYNLAVEARQSTSTAAEVQSAIVFSVTGSSTPGYGDSFEGSAPDPFWTLSQSYGSVSVTSEHAHSGAQSLRFASVPGGQRDMRATHRFAAPVRGRFSVWFLDVAPGQETLYEFFRLENNATDVHAAIGTMDYDSNCYVAVVTRQGVNSGPDARCGRYPQVSTTGVLRTPGWHQLEILVEASSVTFGIDGAPVYSEAGSFSFDEVQFTVSGPHWRPDTQAFYDDFEFIPAPQ